MYPTISYALKDLFGIDIQLPIQSFGFFMALSFIIAALILSKEIKRKTSAGLLPLRFRTVVKGKAASASELIFTALIAFVIFYKAGNILFNYSAFSADPQAGLISLLGSWPAGLVGAAAATGLRYYEKKKALLPQPKTELIPIEPFNTVSDITLLAALFGLLGAKLFDNFEHWDDFVHHPIEALLSFSGLTFYGGLIFGAGIVVWYSVKNKLPLVTMADAVAPSLMLAYGMGRVGCHVAGDGDWGIQNLSEKPSWFFLPDWAWAYRYPHNVLDEGVAIDQCDGRFCHQLQFPVFPTPFYEASICILLFFVIWFFRKRIKTPGLLFVLYLALNGVERFLVELIRVNERYHAFGIAFSQAEMIAVLLIASAALLPFLLPRMKGGIWLKENDS